MITPLSNREMAVLRQLAQGKTYEQIRQSLVQARRSAGKPHPESITIQNVHSTANIIRRKTGILDALNKEECRAFLRHRHSSFVPDPHKVPTRRQMGVLRLVVSGVPYEEIARRLKLDRCGPMVGSQNAQNYASKGCVRIGIRVPARQRTEAIRQWLAEYDAKIEAQRDPMDDPMF